MKARCYLNLVHIYSQDKLNVNLILSCSFSPNLIFPTIIYNFNVQSNEQLLVQCKFDIQIKCRAAITLPDFYVPTIYNFNATQWTPQGPVEIKSKSSAKRQRFLIFPTFTKCQRFLMFSYQYLQFQRPIVQRTTHSTSSTATSFSTCSSSPPSTSS